MPKTGGTFVAKTLQRIHEQRGDRVQIIRASDKQKHSPLKRALLDFFHIDGLDVNRLPSKAVRLRLRLESERLLAEHHDNQSHFARVFLTNHRGEVTQHVRCYMIPEKYLDRPILATVRNPYDRYVSQYEYKLWTQNDFYLKHRVRRLSPHFPNLSFEEYVMLMNEIFSTKPNPKFPPGETPGFHTQQFFEFFFRDPAETVKSLSPSYITSGTYKQDMYNVHFLHTENLNQELHSFLLSTGYDRNDIDFILTAEKILPLRGRSADQKWEKYYTPELKQYVRRKERLMFELFPEYDF
jgi:hypothetical protein